MTGDDPRDEVRRHTEPCLLQQSSEVWIVTADFDGQTEGHLKVHKGDRVEVSVLCFFIARESSEITSNKTSYLCSHCQKGVQLKIRFHKYNGKNNFES